MILSKEEILKEIVECRTNPIHYLEQYGRVRHPIRGIVPFKLYDFQKDVVIKVVNNRFVIIAKGRQLGLSTLLSGYSVWLASFFNSKQILILANKGDVATNFISKCKIFIKYIPEYMRPKILVNNRQSIELENGSVIKASTTTVDAARSEALSLLIVDEAAMIRPINEVWTAARPTLSTGGAAVIISTPCVSGDTKIKIRNKITQEIKEINIEELKYDYM